MEIKLIDLKIKEYDKINFTFNENKINSFIGSNNSGINNILNAICGYEKIEKGYIKIDNKKIELNSSKKEIEELKKYFFRIKENERNMLFNINILEDIKYYVKELNAEKINELFKSFNLDESIFKKNYLELSDSEYQKIVLIIAIMIDSKIVILENPTNSLDVKSTQNLIKQLKKLKRDKCILLTSYDTDFLLEISDNVIVVDKNKIIASGNKYEIFSNEELLTEVKMKVPNIHKF